MHNLSPGQNLLVSLDYSWCMVRQSPHLGSAGSAPHNSRNLAIRW